MRSAIFYITDDGHALAQRLRELYPDARVVRFKPEAVHGIWPECDNLIFIMAAGIVVRTISPLVDDKRHDPSVVVLDEQGRFAVSLLSGHLGGANERAREIADFLNSGARSSFRTEAVITTASDINNLPSLDLWARDNDLVIEDWGVLPQLGTCLVNNGVLRVYTDTDIVLPAQFLKVDNPEIADMLITNKKNVRLGHESPAPAGGPLCSADSCRAKGQLLMIPRNLVIGIGCNSGTKAEEIKTAVKGMLDKHNLSISSLHSVATIDRKASEPGLLFFAQKHGIKIASFTPDELNRVEGIAKSEAALKATGANAVAEPAALLASGAGTLLVRKQKSGNVTMAVAEKKHGSAGMEKRGKIYVVGTGPGGLEHITPHARKAIRGADVIVGYGTYLELIEGLIQEKEVFSTGMTKEIDRCKKAVDLAREGLTVAVISGGDPGIYAMAGLVLELLKGSEELSPPSTHPSLSVEIIPGISALNACAARLGAPLMHDFASISLSDRLTPWNLIEKRLEAAAMADFVIILYNPKSMGRQEHIERAQDIIAKHRAPGTPVGIVKGAMRENEKVIITDLEHMLDHEIDMQTAVIIGNSKTFAWNNLMITPRGYENKK